MISFGWLLVLWLFNGFNVVKEVIYHDVCGVQLWSLLVRTLRERYSGCCVAMTFVICCLWLLLNSKAMSEFCVLGIDKIVVVKE